MQQADPNGPIVLIERRIYLIRSEKVMLDFDLAELYGVLTERLKQQIRRNPGRFPPDFAFQLTKEETRALSLQIASSKKGKGGRRYCPYAFTEQGVAMLSSVLRSERAIQVNIAIMRIFVRIRVILASNKELAYKVEALERKYGEHEKKFKKSHRWVSQGTGLEQRRRIGYTLPTLERP